MFDLFCLWFGAVLRIFHNRQNLLLENLALRQQLVVLKADIPNQSSVLGEFLERRFSQSFWPVGRSRRSRPYHVGNQLEAGFIGKCYMGTQPRSVFLIRGQSSCFQRWIAFSSRSRARRSGFWGLHFKRCIKRPI
jgi:hypothetical protein